MSDNIARNNELYPAVLAGDRAACEAMILNNLGLVVVKADALICLIPKVAYLRDDLVSAGNIGLVQGVNKIEEHHVCMEAVNSWLGQSITNEMLQLLPVEQPIQVPRRSDDLARENGCPIEMPSVFNAFPENLETCSEDGAVDLRDTIEACCESEAERECLRLREEGYTLPRSATCSAFRLWVPSACSIV